MLDPLPVKLASGLQRSLQSFLPSVTAVWLSVGWSCRLQLFNFAYGWEHLQGNPVDLSEQPEIGHSVRCKEEVSLRRHCSVGIVHSTWVSETLQCLQHKFSTFIAVVPNVFELTVALRLKISRILPVSYRKIWRNIHEFVCLITPEHPKVGRTVVIISSTDIQERSS